MKFKFQIRDLFWLMVVVACCLLWWREHAEVIQWRAQSEQEAARARAMMDFLNQSMSTLTAPPTAPQTPMDQGPVAPDERPNSDDAEFKLGDR